MVDDASQLRGWGRMIWQIRRHGVRLGSEDDKLCRDVDGPGEVTRA